MGLMCEAGVSLSKTRSSVWIPGLKSFWGDLGLGSGVTSGVSGLHRMPWALGFTSMGELLGPAGKEPGGRQHAPIHGEAFRASQKRMAFP